MKSQASRSIQELPGCLNCKNASSHRTEKKSSWIRFGLFKRFYLGWDLDRSALFPQKNCPFPLRWVTLLCHTKFHTDLFPCRCGSRCFGAKWQLAFWPDLMYFPPFFFFVLRHKREKKITSISLPICCPSSDVWPCFISFHLFTFITVIPFDLLRWPQREAWRLFEMAPRKTPSSSLEVVVGTFTKLSDITIQANFSHGLNEWPFVEVMSS